MAIMGGCRFAIHDISRTQLSGGLPRFNMPFELGIFVGAKKFGGAKHSSKICLVLDAIPYRYQRTLSDIAGQDIQIHSNRFEEIVLIVRNWLSQFETDLLPGNLPITSDYQRFIRDFPQICRDSGLTTHRIPYNDFVNIMKAWIAKKGAVV
jgi:hypothetical protein